MGSNRRGDPINSRIKKIEPQFQIEELCLPIINMLQQAIPEPSSDKSPSDKLQITRKLRQCIGCDKFGKVGTHCYYYREVCLPYNLHNHNKQEIPIEVKVSRNDDNDTNREQKDPTKQHSEIYKIEEKATEEIHNDATNESKRKLLIDSSNEDNIPNVMKRDISNNGVAKNQHHHIRIT